MAADDPYQRLIGPMLARDDGPDPELMSQLSLQALAWAARGRQWSPWRGMLASTAAVLRRQDSRLQQHCLGLTFPNPLGLAAGFDKNGVAAPIWHCFGFGFAELGTMTALPQRGNPRPRLFRLAAEQAALNRMGFNNHGSRRAATVLTEQQLPPPGQRPALLGLNIGKSRATTMAAAAEDYAVSYSRLAPPCRLRGDQRVFPQHPRSPGSAKRGGLETVDRPSPGHATAHAAPTLIGENCP